MRQTIAVVTVSLYTVLSFFGHQRGSLGFGLGGAGPLRAIEGGNGCFHGQKRLDVAFGQNRIFQISQIESLNRCVGRFLIKNLAVDVYIEAYCSYAC